MNSNKASKASLRYNENLIEESPPNPKLKHEINVENIDLNNQYTHIDQFEKQYRSNGFVKCYH